VGTFGIAGPLPPQAASVRLNKRMEGYAARFKTGHSYNGYLEKLISRLGRG
jgi:hypothetical protein